MPIAEFDSERYAADFEREVERILEKRRELEVMFPQSGYELDEDRLAEYAPKVKTAEYEHTYTAPPARVNRDLSV